MIFKKLLQKLNQPKAQASTIIKNNKINILLSLVILIASSLLIGYNLGKPPLKFFDEGIYAEVTKNMLVRGDYFSMIFADNLWFEKPPYTCG